MAQYEQSATPEQQAAAVASVSSGTTDAIASLLTSLEDKEGQITLLQNDGSERFRMEDQITSVGLIAQNVNFTSSSSVASSTAYVSDSTGTFTSSSNTAVTHQLNNSTDLTYNNFNGQNNDITFTGNSTNVSANTGDGDDTFTVNGNFTGAISSLGGNNEINLDTLAQSNAEVSVDTGNGFDVMNLLGPVTKHHFEFANQRFHMQSANVSMKGVEMVQTDVDGDGNLEATDGDHVTLLATDAQDSLAAKLYVAALGREMFDTGDEIKTTDGDQLSGIKFWMNMNAAEDSDLVHSFFFCDETQAKLGGLSNEEFVNKVMSNIGKFDGALNAAFAEKVVSELDSGTIDQADALLEIVNAWQADANHQIVGGDGQVYVVEGFTDDTTSA